VSGLTAFLDIRAPDSTQRRVSLPETTGVTAYYETMLAFEQKGEHAITFVSTAAGVPFSSTFHKVVSGNALFGDWSTFVGHLMVFLAFTVTWIGVVLSVQQRFSPPRPPS
jgi:glucose uptake protein GlcU